MTNSTMKNKRALAEYALRYIPEDTWIGIGSGSTVNALIDALADHKHLIKGAVPASIESEAQLKSKGIPTASLNDIGPLSHYFDGADEVDKQGNCIKGGGGALAREKVIAAASKRFVVLIEQHKQVTRLGKKMPIPIEVLPMARSFVARKMVALGGQPEYRHGFVTDNGNEILDVHHLHWESIHTLDQTLNALPGVIAHGVFVEQKPDHLIIAHKGSIQEILTS
jgi:ribose 5-phosphate isomerase A